MVQTDEELKESGLVYISDKDPGFSRKGKPGRFYYVDMHGKRLTEGKHLERIKSLVLPPAWRDVWISPKANGHLQAVGVDAAGRKQYKYHPKWTTRRSDHKYFRLLEFGKALPEARKRIAKDLKRKNFDERKVLAICIEVLQKTLIRIGNESYKRQYGSYGLTTLRDKHAKINGSHLTLNFIGKKGVRHEVEYNDRHLANLVKKCRDIPGQELFQYYSNGSQHCSIGSSQINNYIKEITGDDFTAKDFRTWGGTLEALRQMARCASEYENKSKKKAIVEVLDCVARKLGNTRTVCKNSYVYPLLLEAYEQDAMGKYLKQLSAIGDNNKEPDLAEKVLMRFLKNTRNVKPAKQKTGKTTNPH